MNQIRIIEAEETLQIRQAVLWPDHPIDHVRLADDDQGIHYGLYHDGHLSSVISVFIKEGQARFRKFATLKEDQGKGYGTALFTRMLSDLEAQGLQRIWCDARVEAMAFYMRFGFVEATGEIFYKGQVAYKVLEKTLDSL